MAIRCPSLAALRPSTSRNARTSGEAIPERASLDSPAQTSGTGPGLRATVLQVRRSDCSPSPLMTRVNGVALCSSSAEEQRKHHAELFRVPHALEPQSPDERRPRRLGQPSAEIRAPASDADSQDLSRHSCSRGTRLEFVSICTRRCQLQSDHVRHGCGGRRRFAGTCWCCQR